MFLMCIFCFISLRYGLRQKVLGLKQILHILVFSSLYFCVVKMPVRRMKQINFNQYFKYV